MMMNALNSNARQNMWTQKKEEEESWDQRKGCQKIILTTGLVFHDHGCGMRKTRENVEGGVVLPSSTREDMTLDWSYPLTVEKEGTEKG